MRNFLTRALIALICLGILAFVAVFIFLSSERKSGEKKWKEALAEFEADGESLDPSIRFSPPIPDDENFGAIPLLRNITAASPEGESVRAQLEKLALKAEDGAWPKKKRKRDRNAHRRWEETDLEALHEYFLASNLLPLDPDAENVSADLRRAIETEYGEQIAALHDAAATRPHAQFVPPLSEVYPPGAPIIVETIHHLKSAQSVAKVLLLHSLVSIRTGDPDQAVAGMQALFKLADASEADGKNLISFLVAHAIRKHALQIAWEGIGQRVFDNQQLERIETLAREPDPLLSLTNAYRSELIVLLDALDRFEDNPAQFGDEDGLHQGLGAPLFLSTWFDHNRAAILEGIHHPIIKPSKSTAPYLAMRDEGTKMQAQLEERMEEKKYFFVNIALPMTSTPPKRTAELHAALHQLAIACMLERYFLQNNHYPENLQQLIPDFTTALPADPIDNNPMRYKKTDDGRYQLHSIGWDGIDDQGGERDIVWSYRSTSP